MMHIIKHRMTLVVVDALLITFAFVTCAKWFNVDVLAAYPFYLLFLGCKIYVFGKVGLYRAILRFSGLPIATTILKATAVTSVVCYGAAELFAAIDFPVGFYATDYLMTNFFAGLFRFLPRIISDAIKPLGAKRILIYGAGMIGEEVARKLLRNSSEYQLVGFVDDSRAKIGKSMHNVPIFGPIDNLESIVQQQRVSELIIAISALKGEAIRDVTRKCRHQKVFCRIVPSFTNLLKKDVDIKNLDIRDLLRRKPQDLDIEQISRFVQGRTVMITGAGGSIGSELSRQCVQYGVGRLILVDHSEYNLYALQEELSAHDVDARYCLMNVLHGGLEHVMDTERPAIVFHAAAYKHVPMLEDNASEGVICNIGGTVQTAKLAEKYGVKKFVLISTDKAVRPTNIMGASKRVAELFIQNFNARSATDFVAVRFGNVLGSSGSVIPKFAKQINEGGPVTVTHKDVTRYFMLTSEAVQLVLQAAGLGKGGEIFILNMGQPIRISEMAEDLIFLSGREPHKDIAIEYIGLRPGEKLYEELIIEGIEKRTQYENITIGHSTRVEWLWLTDNIDALLEHAKSRNETAMIQCLTTVVPEFCQASSDGQLAPKDVPLRASVRA